MSRLLDLSGTNPNTGKPWWGIRAVVWNGVRIEMQWPNHQLGESPTQPLATCLHWTACQRNLVFNDYGMNCIAGPDGVAYLVKMVAMTQKEAHLWHRNGYVRGNTICSNPEQPGQEPLESQVELIAQWNAEECAWKNIDPRGMIEVDQLACDSDATKIWETGGRIQIPRVWDHAHFAHIDGYGPWRYDCNWKLPNGKTVFEFYYERTLAIYDELKSGARQFEFADALRS
jgi:hypothetical protein